MPANDIPHETVTIPIKRWVRLLRAVALADHTGDAADDMRQFARLSGLPMPPDSAEFSVAEEDQTAENSWIGWAKSLGVDADIWSDDADHE